jgi:hypothetical protein
MQPMVFKSSTERVGLWKVLLLFVSSERSAERSKWERLRDLYEFARRRALDSGKVVADLLASLDKIA